MSEIEAAAADGAAAILRRRPRHALPVGSPCPNCATALAGPWCHACGQSAEDYHRSLLRLVAEAVEGLFELDGRLWRTLPDLILNPARLTRRYLDGHRAPQAPPFRTFLIVVVLVFLVAGLGESRTHAVTAKPATVTPSIQVLDGPQGKAISAWLTSRARAAASHPEAFDAILSTWAQRMAVLALPMSAAILGLLFVFRRGVYMFDHLIFSMHSLSFQGLLFAVVSLGERLSGWVGVLILASPVHLFFHLKGTYGLGVFGTLARMVLLFVGSLLGFVLIMAGLVLIGLYEVGR
ncbi:MAG TPA: DUF3667 domain-containing protein [Caulobacteraceae bacterium]|nr:DUF3667 domain-containing protein [Caulobacteraceae bacterium]